MAAATVISAGPASPRSLVLPPLLPLLSLLLHPLSRFHPFLQSFLLFLLLSFIGLSCKCSCWPPILVVLRSLPKSNKHSWSSSPSLSVCVPRGEPCCGIFLFFPFLFPQILRVLIRGFLQWRPTLACPRPDDSCLLRLVWLASFVAIGELPSLRDFFSS